MKRTAHPNELVNFFLDLEKKVKLNNSSGLTDINIVSENFFCHLLNKMFDLNLVNINLEKLNFPAIDLADSGRRKTFQITSVSTKSKIKKTLCRFDDHKLNESYDSLDIIVIEVKKTNIKEDLKLNCGIPFDKNKNVIDLSDLVKLILSLSNEKQEIILDFLGKELGNTPTQVTNRSTEVQTLIDLVGYLTSKKTPGTEEWKEEPDPEQKIKHRFSEHSDYLEREILRLLPLYSSAKNQVTEVLGLDSVKIEFIRRFLQTKSESFLIDTAGDPKKALDKFTEFLEEKLSSSGVIYDNQAIRFYLIDELIKCNVFPNH